MDSSTSRDATLQESAARIRSLLAGEALTPETFRSALASVPREGRDAWLDLVLGTGEIPADGPDLPSGCVPYLPCPVDALVRMVDQAGIGSRDTFVDIGSGLGRAATLTHLLTGAAAIGLEIQPHLVSASRDLAQRLKMARFSVIHGDAARLTGFVTIGSVFFLYCPFGAERLDRVLDDLEDIARTREIRVCCVDLPLAPRPWLARVPPEHGDLAVYRSTLLDAN